MDIPLIFAFFSGIAAAFNPCGAAMLPAYIGFHLGTYKSGENLVSLTLNGISFGLLSTLGFVTLFSFVGIILVAGGYFIGKFLPLFGLLTGLLICGLGIWLLITKSNIYIQSASKINIGNAQSIRNMYIFGIGYGIASLSCALPLFLVAVGLIAGTSLSSGKIIETVIGSIAYGLGMGTVLILTSLGTIFFKEAVSVTINKFMKHVEILGKLSMILAGAYLIHYWIIGKGSSLLQIP
ncbi:MAG: hypothetical protein FI687_05190 [SAR202 cluster bacterium]|nr:hypothetical protein [SAR202 cluster bacterium]|tara:strand:+ start:40624 stop:41334 length:711 start_codon:yes stop_codon:yes gene_type:complete